jgi:hypothetical protein
MSTGLINLVGILIVMALTIQPALFLLLLSYSTGASFIEEKISHNVLHHYIVFAY